MYESLNDEHPLSPKIISLSHIGGRLTQQDQIWPRPDQSISFDQQSDLLLVVADGAGGHQGGDVASQIVIDTVVEQYAMLRKQQTPKKALINAIREAHERIKDRQLVELDKQDMASTIVALVLTPQSEEKREKPSYQICVANVGDSRAYLYRPQFALTQLSQDHTLVQEEVRQEHLTPEQAKIHPLRHRLSQALGGTRELNIFATQAIHAKSHDRYLLCTDGLTDVLDDAHIQTILSEQAATEQVAQALMKQALPDAQDNVSFILLDIMPVRLEQSRQLAKNMTQSWRGRIVVLLFFLLAIALTVAVVLNLFANELSFAPATAEVNNEISIISRTKTKPTPTQTSQQPVVQTTSNRQKTTNTASATATQEPTLTFNRDVVGNAATPAPSATSTPLAQIVEYRTGPDRIIFESMVGWGGQNQVCKGASSQIPIAERVNYPYEHAIRPVEPPIVEQRGSDIYIKFDAIAAKPRACGLERYHERVIELNAQQGEWIIKDAELTKKMIPVHPNSQISLGGWIIFLKWQ